MNKDAVVDLLGRAGFADELTELLRAGAQQLINQAVEAEIVDVYLSDTRDIAAAEKFFKNCKTMLDDEPEQITTDKEPALYTAIENSFGSQTKHRDSKYKNNVIEQSHRMIK